MTDLSDLARSILMAPFDDRPGADDGDSYRDADDERHERIAEKRAKLSAEALRGDGYFWTSGGYDAEYEIIAAVRSAFSAIGLTDAERYQMIQSEVYSQITRYVDNEVRDE